MIVLLCTAAPAVDHVFLPSDSLCHASRLMVVFHYILSIYILSVLSFVGVKYCYFTCCLPFTDKAKLSFGCGSSEMVLTL